MLNEQRIEENMLREFQEEQVQKQDMEALIKGPAQAAAIPASAIAAVSGMGAAPAGGMPPGPGGAPGGPMPAGAPMGGGMGAPMGGGGANTPDQKMVEADQIATQLLAMDDLSRRQALSALRNSDQTLHALTTARLEKLRSQLSSQGRQMIQQQMAGGGPPM